jgi:hypothetical protein
MATDRSTRHCGQSPLRHVDRSTKGSPTLS